MHGSRRSLAVLGAQALTAPAVAAPAAAGTMDVSRTGNVVTLQAKAVGNETV